MEKETKHTPKRVPGFYFVKKIRNASSYQDLDPWEVARFDDLQNVWHRAGALAIWPESYWDEINETELSEMKKQKNDLENVLGYTKEAHQGHLERMAKDFIEQEKQLFEMKKEREELIGASQLIVDALVQSNIYMKELVGGVFGEHALNHYQQIISRIKK